MPMIVDDPPQCVRYTRCPKPATQEIGAVWLCEQHAGTTPADDDFGLTDPTVEEIAREAHNVFHGAFAEDRPERRAAIDASWVKNHESVKAAWRAAALHVWRRAGGVEIEDN